MSLMEVTEVPMDIYQKALRELAIIESEIEEKTRRRDALREFISMGNSLFQESRNSMAHHPSLFDDDEAAHAAQVHSRASRSNTLSHRVAIAVEAILKSHGPTATKELLPLLEEQGIEIGGENKVSTLSVLLSRNERFVANRSTGWKLRPEGNEFMVRKRRVLIRMAELTSSPTEGLPEPEPKRPNNATTNETNNDDEL